MDDSSEIDVELAVRVDELAGEFAKAIESDPGLTAEQFADRHPDVSRDALLAVLRGAGVLRRATRGAEGPFAPGSKVGRYRIKDVIGRGGMGIVYEAVEEELGRAVALKAVDSVRVDDRMRARFVREARAAAQLDHPAIVPVFGSGETDGVLWYAMRRVQGRSLDELLRDLEAGDETRRASALGLLADAASSGSSGSASGSALNLPSRVRGSVLIVKRLAEALSYAHSSGILHRDIKPGNVLLDANGAPLLADFGLCKVEDEASLTAASDVVGTLRYMPPEALEGAFDSRGDVYSLGLLLYELLSGRPALISDSRQAMIHQVLRVEPPALTSVAPSVSQDVARVVTKAISKLPEERYATAAALVEDLEALLAGRAVQARPQSALYQARLFVRRNRALSGTVFLALMGAIAGTAAYVAQLKVANQRVSDALAESRRNETYALISGAESTLQLDEMGRTRRLLDAVLQEQRDWMWRHLDARVGEASAPERVALRDPLKAIQNDEQSLLAAFGLGGLVVFERNGLREIGRLDGQFESGGFGGDGRDLFLTTYLPRKLVHVRVEGGALVQRTVCDLDFNEGKVAALEGSQHAFLRSNLKSLRVVDVESGEEVWKAEYPVEWISVFEALSEDEVVLGLREGDVFRIKRGAQRPTRVSGHPGTVSAILVRDGEILATGGEDGSVVLLPALTGHGKGFLTLGEKVESFSLAQDGTGLLAATLWDRSTVLIRPETCAIERTLTGFEAMPIGVGFGQDPWLITFTAAGELAHHSRGDHDGRIPLTPGFGDLGPLAVSDDGRQAVTYGSDWILYLHDLEQLSVRFTAVGSRDAESKPSFHRSGDWLSLGRVVLSTEDFSPRHTVEFKSSVVRSTFMPSGALIALANAAKPEVRAAGAELTVVRCSGFDGEGDIEEQRRSLGTSTDYGVGIIPDGTRVLLALRGGRFVCLDAASLDVIWDRTLELEEVRSFAVDSAKGELYVAARDGLVHVFRSADGEAIEGRKWRVSTASALQEQIASMIVGPGPDRITTCTNDGRIKLWDPETGRRSGALSRRNSWLKHLSVVPGTDWLLTAGYFGRIELFGHGAVPSAAWPDAPEPGFVLSDVAELYHDIPPIRPRLEGSAKRAQRFRYEPEFWSSFLKEPDEQDGR